MPSFFRRRSRYPLPHRNRHHQGLTLAEILVTLAILSIVMVALVEMVAQADRAWHATAADRFAEAQEAFDTIARHLAAATLEPYEDYADAGGSFRTNTATTFVPDHLARRSDLAFVCGPASGANGLLTFSGRTTAGSALFFLAPEGYTQTYSRMGLDRLLNASGYFVEFGDDENAPSFVSSHSWRWRLKQVTQPSENLQIYRSISSQDWLRQLVPSGAATSVLAVNVITLLAVPERAANDSGTALSTDYRYDSRDGGQPLTRHQLPARMRLALVAIDEASARLLAMRYGSSPPPLVAGTLFQDSSHLDADLSTLDGNLTAQKIEHRIFQREILLSSAAWSETSSQ